MGCHGSHLPIVFSLLAVAVHVVNCHHTWSFRHAENAMKDFTKRHGVVVSFEKPVYSNGYFQGFEAWEMINKQYGAENITWIVRVEFDNSGFRENKIRRRYKLFWLPGALWVELSSRRHIMQHKNLTSAKHRNHSHIDIWVTPSCFLRHNGISRIHRVAKSIKLNVHYLRWMAKINYEETEMYGTRELIEISKSMTSVSGIQCAWVHPLIDSSFSMMLRFFPDKFPQKSFFSPTHGYTNWDFLNNDYQAESIHCLRGWNRALIDFAGGIHCKESNRKIAERYQALPSIQFIYLDTLDECRFTYQIVLAFDKKSFNKQDLKHYQSWNNLNYIYGVIKITYENDSQLKSVLEFEPGLYTHQQMKAIRDEYLKLPGIKFGWVMGKRALEVSTIVLNFEKNFLRRVPMHKYQYWNSLNKKYYANITIQDEVNLQAFIRFPKGVHTDVKLKAILRKYRQLPGIASVRMDKEEFHLLKGAPESNSAITNSSWSTPPRRSLKSWIQLSQGDTSNLPQEQSERNFNKFYSTLPNQCISSS